MWLLLALGKTALFKSTPIGKDKGMVKISESDMNFIQNTLPKDLQERILQAKTVNDVLYALNDWIDLYPDCWEANGEDYNDLGRATQRVYDNIYLYGED